MALVRAVDEASEPSSGARWRSRSANFWIFPQAVWGNSSTVFLTRGAL
jgi:hypothetical protein